MKILDENALGQAVIVALGSNMGSEYGAPDAVLERAFAAFEDRGIGVVARSRQWRSQAWPDPAAPAYRNAVCLVDTALEPKPLLSALHEIERTFGRVRSQRNAPRILDLDLIAYGRRISSADPVIPHPRAQDRLFVMGPLAEIAPGWRHPVSGLTAQDLADRATVALDAAPVG